MKKLFILCIVLIIFILTFSACSAPPPIIPDYSPYQEYPTEVFTEEYPEHSAEMFTEEEPEYPAEVITEEDPAYPAEIPTEKCPEYPIAQDAYSEIIIHIPNAHTRPGDIAIQHIIFMNDYLYARTAFTYRELEAAQWLVETLLAMGYDEADIQLQEFSRDDAMSVLPITDYSTLATAISDFAGEREKRNYSQNVILTIPGESEQTIIVGAHYDTWPFPGAADNGSGVALLLENAQRMRNLEPYHTIIYIFFGAEEIGLLGARYYLSSLSEEELENILFMLNADLLFEGPALVYCAGVKITGVRQGGLVGENRFTRAWDTIAYELNTLHDDLELISYPEGLGQFFSDHYVFYTIEIPVIVFSGLYQRSDGTISVRRPFLFQWEYHEDGTPYARWTDTYQEGVFSLYSGILHGSQDCFHFINEHFPGKMERAMWGYALFLEAILLQVYS